MSKFTTKIALTVLIMASNGLYADDVETSLEKDLGRKIKVLSVSMKKYDSFKKAVSTDVHREAILRKLCNRLKKDNESVSTAIDALDTYLSFKSELRDDGDEIDDANNEISALKSEIRNLKRTLSIVDKSKSSVVSL